MQIFIEVSADLQREAADQGLSIYQYVEVLIERGRERMRDKAVISSAVDRIRALRRSEVPSANGSTTG